MQGFNHVAIRAAAVATIAQGPEVIIQRSQLCKPGAHLTLAAMGVSGSGLAQAAPVGFQTTDAQFRESGRSGQAEASAFATMSVDARLSHLIRMAAAQTHSF